MSTNNDRRSLIDCAIFLAGLVAIFIIDRLTKVFFTDLISVGESLVVIKNFLHFTLVHNTGIAFGLFKDCGFIFILIPLVLTGLLIYNVYYYRHTEKLSRTYIVAFSLILGGAVGNLYDRLMFGYVIDFIDFRVFPVFNIADSAISIGAGIILLKCIPMAKQPR